MKGTTRRARLAAAVGFAGLAVAGSATAAGATGSSPAPTAQIFAHTATSIQIGYSTTDLTVDTFVITDGSHTWEAPAWQQWWRTLTDLTTNKTYTFTVRARNAAGTVSPPSSPVSVFIENTPPTPPQNLRVESGHLAWDPATDNAGTISRYQVFADGVLRARGRMTTSTAQLQVLDPVTGRPTPGSGTHVFTMKATDSSGNVSGPSNAITVQIP